jgi:hypothetical protein
VRKSEAWQAAQSGANAGNGQAIVSEFDVWQLMQRSPKR